MSGFLGVRKREAIELLSDGATYNPEDGIVVAIASKVEVIDHMRAALIGRGHLPMMIAFARLAGQNCPTFDCMIEHYTELMHDVLAWAVPHIGERALYNEILFAGWSDARERLEVYFEAMHGAWDGADGQLRPAGLAFWAGPICEARDQFIDRYADEAGIEAFDPDLDGIDALEAMRQEVGPLDPAKSDAMIAHAVGGFVEHVTITRAGVDRRIIRVWPDEVGRPIDPFIPLQQGPVAST